jgi:RNA polymerase sigma-70 factor (ECF subfamily)
VGWALACCRYDKTEAEDVLQASYLKVLDGHAVFSGRSTFRTWLFGVIRRTAAEHRRRSVLRRLVRVSPSLWAALTDSSPVALDELVRADENERLRSALCKLSLRQRQVLHLVFQQDLTIEAAAGVMEISVGSARTHYARGKARLLDLLQSDR